MNMKKILSFLCLSALLACSLFVSGCGSESASSKKIDILFPGGLERWETSGQQLKSDLEKQGFTVNLQFAKTGDEQNQQLDAVTESGSACIVIGAVDSKKVGSSLDKAKTKKIPVIAYDRLPLNTDAVSYYATFDNEGIGTAMAQYVIEKYNLKKGAGPYNVEFFQGSDDDNNAHLIDKGMLNELKPYIDRGQLVVASGQKDFQQTTVKGWEPKNAAERTKKLLTQYYSGRQLDIAMCASDSIAEGVVDGLTSAGYSGTWPFITGQDATQKNLALVQQGKQGTTLLKSADVLNNKCVKMVKAVVEGMQPEINDLNTYNNGAITVPTYLCIPLIIDKDNITEAQK